MPPLLLVTLLDTMATAASRLMSYAITPLLLFTLSMLLGIDTPLIFTYATPLRRRAPLPLSPLTLMLRRLIFADDALLFRRRHY